MTDSPTRVERRAQSRSRSRTGLMIGAAVLVVIAVVVGVVLFAGGGDDSSDGGGGSTATPGADTNVTLEAGEVTADSAGPPVTVSQDIADGVIDTIGDYLQVATVAPLRSGEPAGDLAPVVDGAALAPVSGVDRPALVDEGLPKVSTDLDVVAQPVAITGLGDQEGNLVALTATINVDITAAAEGKAKPLHIVRTGYFVLSPDAAGAWKVSAYKMGVTRDGGTLDATTTTAAATPAAPK
ncbi:MAG: hypothetical protein ABW033_07615 [Acidimicrobiia bacterium]